jgi:hypothetical protein
MSGLWTLPCLEPPAQARRSMPCAAGRPLALCAVVVARFTAKSPWLCSPWPSLHPGAFRIANRARERGIDLRRRARRRAPPSPANPPPAVRLRKFPAVRQEICGPDQSSRGVNWHRTGQQTCFGAVLHKSPYSF